MFVAMNRFKIRPGQESAFETIWRERDSHLTAIEGFLSFDLLKGPTHEDHTLYASHTLWTSREAFDAWTRSEAFRAAHKGAGSHGDVYLGHPDFEGFDQVADTAISGTSRAERAGRRPLAERMALNPDGLLEQIAADYGVSTLDVVRHLPPDHATVIGGENTADVLAAVAEWGPVLIIVHTHTVVVEIMTPLPPATVAREHFNFHGPGDFGGHMRVDACAAIAFVDRPFMKRRSLSIQLFDSEGKSIFKIFIARDEARELIADQVAQFRDLRDRLKTVSPLAEA